MREIKFRAWDKKEKKMFIPPWLDWVTNSRSVKNNSVSNVGKRSATQPLDSFYAEPIWEVELMQFTGLKDKNGKDVFEGDILKCSRSYWKKTRNLVVEWGDERYQLTDIEDPVDSEVMDKSSSFDVPQVEREVIGNIYENPNLIKNK